MIRTILGGLLGGFAMYIVGFLFWGTPLSALAYHRAEPQAGANLQAAMAQALNPGGTGVYIIPDPATAEGTVLYGKGPVGMIFYNSTGFPVTDSASLIGGLILALVVGLLIAFALRAIAPIFAPARKPPSYSRSSRCSGSMWGKPSSTTRHGAISSISPSAISQDSSQRA